LVAAGFSLSIFLNMNTPAEYEAVRKMEGNIR